MTWWELVRAQLREARRRKGWSQQKLADELTARGFPLSARAVGKLETGDIRVDIVLLEKIADATNQPLEFFLPNQMPASMARKQIDVLLDQLEIQDLNEIRALAEAKVEYRAAHDPKAISDRRAA